MKKLKILVISISLCLAVAFIFPHSGKSFITLGVLDCLECHDGGTLHDLHPSTSHLCSICHNAHNVIEGIMPYSARCLVCHEACGSIETAASESDSDGILDDIDNCPNTPNSPNIGTCVKVVGSIVMTTRVTCTDNSTCEEGEYCQMEQGDINKNGVGDACECYADFNENGRIDGGDVSILVDEAGLQNCDPYNETSPPCCYADANGNGRIDGGDMFTLVSEANAGRRNCPLIPHCPNIP